MSDSVQYDQAALQSAISEMESAYQQMVAKFDNIVAKSESIASSWKTPEGAKFYAQFETITNGIAEFKASYASIVSFLTGSVSVDYAAIEQEIAAALAAGGGD